MDKQDIVVLGASAGGIQTLQDIICALPADFPGTCFVVQHIAPHSPDFLVQLLSTGAKVTVVAAQNGLRIERGHVYIAVPDRHLLVGRGQMQVVMAARENRSRPAIDPLFRSAAVSYGSRVVGVLLSGLLDDGTSGLLAIRRCNGVTVVQDPEDAQFPDMPRFALGVLTPDHQLASEHIALLLSRLVGEKAKASVPTPADIEAEVNMVHQSEEFSEESNQIGELVALSCPECGGPLRNIDESGHQRFRCRVGHAFRERSLLDEHTEAIERTSAFFKRVVA